MPSTYISTINPVTRGIINVTAVDGEIPEGFGLPVVTLFSLWMPEDVKIGDHVSVVGPYGADYPSAPVLRTDAPVLRTENLNIPYNETECHVPGFELESGAPEEDLWWYATQSKLLAKFYMNWPSCDAETVCLLKEFTAPSAHDLVVSLDTFELWKLEEAYWLNVTVLNQGTSTESKVEVILLLNGNNVDSTLIPELVNGASYTRSVHECISEEGTYNLTAYTHPVPGEINLSRTTLRLS